MNKRGFTLIELLTSISLAAIVCVLIFEVIFSLKDMYVADSVKTEILIKKNNISEKINKTFIDKKINQVRNCSIDNQNCLKFIMDDGSQYELFLDKGNRVVKFGDFTTKFSSSVTFYDDLDACYYFNLTDSNPAYDTFIKIRLPLEDTTLEEKFDINIIYQYYGDNYAELLGEISPESGTIITYIPHC